MAVSEASLESAMSVKVIGELVVQQLAVLMVFVVERLLLLPQSLQLVGLGVLVAIFVAF